MARLLCFWAILQVGRRYMKKNKQRSSTARASRAKSGRRVVVRNIVRNIERPIAPTPKDMAEARKSTSDVVRMSAMGIIAALIKKAEEGEVGPAKYLFEMVGLYPAAEETSPRPEDSLAYTLLQRMGLPTESDVPAETRGQSRQ
jgi:hypothetical protein